MSQECDNNVLHLVKQKGFCPYGYMSDFEKLEEKLPCKEKLCSSLADRRISEKNMNMSLMLGKNLKWKRWKIITTCI